MIADHRCKQLDRVLLELPIHLGGLCHGKLSQKASRKHASSVKVTTPLIIPLKHTSYKAILKLSHTHSVAEKAEEFKDRTEETRARAAQKIWPPPRMLMSSTTCTYSAQFIIERNNNLH